MKKKKIISVLTSVALACSTFAGVNINNSAKSVSAADSTVTSHSVVAGTSKDNNPLKGMLGYSGTDSFSFPHSMEWFYIPVSDVQTGMNSFDWTALEDKLNDVASRGHQSVFRFYYDYPGEESGVPQFVIDNGLKMSYYNEPDNLGGAGYAPDYSDEYFRQSMQTFIKAFGEKYDGDGRIGYITVGLLGFWGEWHNWPYDEDTSDGKPDWSIPTAVYQEVLDAFDDAFNVTKICVREPKSGLDNNKYHVGYHDDSYGYATLSTKSGGQDWSFMQKLYNFNLGEAWKTECIGGEVYPPSQDAIFSGASPVSGNFQDWYACQSESHATWMLNEKIKYYSGDSYNNALAAAKGMGYDLRVTNAYYADTVSSGNLYLKIDMDNIGVAPFYYGHDTWPVQIALKKNGNIMATYTTDWDLNKVEAGGSYSFEHTELGALNSLPEGQYEINIKVVNPIASGVIFSFANANQTDDGWLPVGNINVINEEETTTVTTAVKTGEPLVLADDEAETTDSHTGTCSWQDDNYIYCSVQPTVSYEHWQVFIDTDDNKNTGYLYDNGGYEYIIEDGNLYYHSGNSTDWSLDFVTAEITKKDNENGFTICIPKSSLGDVSASAKVRPYLIYDNWNSRTDCSEMTAVYEKSNDTGCSIDGFQISYLNKGIRTVYSFNRTINGKSIDEVGLIYGIDKEGFNASDMIYQSTNQYVAFFAGTKEKGKASVAVSRDDTYVMTMKFGTDCSEELTQKYYVRAYARLSDGSFVYGNIVEYRIIDVATALYEGNEISQEKKAYIYDRIIRKIY